jgi:hypothetical protein
VTASQDAAFGERNSLDVPTHHASALPVPVEWHRISRRLM